METPNTRVLALPLALPLARAGAVWEGCKQGVDECADHTLACKSGKRGTLGGWKTRRHNAYQTLLLGLAKVAGLEDSDGGGGAAD